MNEVAPGIYRIKLPLPTALKHINSYLVRGDKGCLLVDTGLDTKRAFASFKKQLGEIGVGVEDITQIVITHIHPDHYGLTGRIKDLSSAKFYLHYLEQALIDSRYVHMDDLLTKIADTLRRNGVPPAELPDLQTASLGLAQFVTHALPDVTLRGGEIITTGNFNFRVLWTPGHSPGQVCLYEPDRKVLLSGDHVLPGITPNIGLHPQTSDNPLGDYLLALNAVKDLDVDIVLPGHEEPFTGLRARVARIIQHHDKRNTEILATIKAGPLTGYQIAKGINWMIDGGGTGWDNLSQWDRRLAVLETLAHLESMRFDGRVNRFSTNGVSYYRLD